MPRILGVDIPNDKITAISLTYIYGIGRRTALEICAQLKLNPQLRAKKLSEDELSRIATLLDTKYPVEGQLRRAVQQSIVRKKKNGSYRGLRHGRKMPVSGQRTRTNARTRKGKRKTVAGKKSVKAMR
jgi:small subunit ribosomal protein S13